MAGRNTLVAVPSGLIALYVPVPGVPKLVVPFEVLQVALLLP